MKLVYFNCQGLAEVSRFILAISGDKYEDYRYPLKAIDLSKHQFEKKEFDHDKASGVLSKSMDKVPYFVFDGVVISQSKAIERFLARKYDLYGTNEVVSAQIDAFSEAIRDIKDAYFREKKSPDGDRDKWIREELPRRLVLLSSLISEKENIFTGDYVFENRLSLADILLYHFIIHFFDNKEDSLKAIESTTLSSIVQKMSENERLKNWLKTRPETDF